MRIPLTKAEFVVYRGVWLFTSDNGFSLTLNSNKI